MASYWCCCVLTCLLLSLPIISCSSSIVNNLPGFGDLPFYLETGYVGVGEAEEVQLFYFFIESQRNPTSDPLLLWFVGGPGCSALSAFFYENGPLVFNYAKFNGSFPELQLNPCSWTKVFNMIYVDTPVGAGFSYSRTQQGYYNSDKQWIENAYDFLQKWLNDHPEFQSNPLYIGGSSYSGIPIPPHVQKVYEGSKAGSNPLMNIQGFVLASPVTDAYLDRNTKVQFAHQHTLISDELYESIKVSCNGDYVNIDPNNSKCVGDYEAYLELVHDIDEYQIFETICISASHENQRILLNSKTVHQTTFWCRDYDYMLVDLWAKDVNVRKALNVREGTKNQFQRCNKTDLAYTRNIESVVGYHRNLTDAKLRSLTYCGDIDMAVPHLSTHSWIKSLNLKVNNTWHAWYHDGQVAGYTETYKKNEYYMTYATVKGAGHVAQERMPKQVYQLIDRWFSCNPL